MDPQTPSAAPTPNNPLAVGEAGKQAICEIKRHPIGIIGIYAMAGFLLVFLAVLIFGVAPSVFSGSSHSQIMSVGMVVFLIAAILVAAFSLIAHVVYWGNRWIVNSTSITQVTRSSLFDKQTSQLSLGDLEDITAEQDGPLAQMFHFGTLSAETAAATDKFTFLYCPDPTVYAKKILAAREDFEQHRRTDPQPTAHRASARSIVDVGITAVESLDNK
ncbi:MAG TPA: hypothetical protein VIJ68_02605 [Candidatus Saccharimonadales bacterium]